jgi:lysyl-tRNA synthetase class 2
LQEDVRTPQNDNEQRELSELLQIRRDKLIELQNEGMDPFLETVFDRTHWSSDIKENFSELEGTQVRVAGRLMSKRGMGKVSFCDLADREGTIQLYARSNDMDAEQYERFRKYDIADIVGVEG